MQIHGKVSEVITGSPSARQTTLLVIMAEGEDEPHAFYLSPETVQDLKFKLLCPLRINPTPKMLARAR